MSDELPTTEQAETTSTTEGSLPAKKKGKSRGRNKAKSKITKGKIFINSTYNNTIVSVTDLVGNVVVSSSAGRVGFKGSKKSTPYAGQRTMEDALAKAKERGLVEADVFVKGIGSGRESAIRALHGSSLVISVIKDQTPTPHGGVRQKKIRRV